MEVKRLLGITSIVTDEFFFLLGVSLCLPLINRPFKVITLQVSFRIRSRKLTLMIVVVYLNDSLA